MKTLKEGDLAQQLIMKLVAIISRKSFRLGMQN